MTEPPARDPLTAQSVKEIRGAPAIRDLRNATVRVRNKGCGTLATGSGVVLGPDLIATNRHVVDGANQLEINTWDGRTLQVNVAAAATDTDLAIVRIDGALPTAIRFAPEEMVTGQPITVAGYPEGRRLAFSPGTVRGSGEGPFGEVEGVIYVDADVRPGNSGGPVANSDGELVGLVYAGARDEAIGAVIPAERLRRLQQEDGFTTVPPCTAQSPAEAAIAAGYGQAQLPPPPDTRPCPAGAAPSIATTSFEAEETAARSGQYSAEITYSITNPRAAEIFVRQTSAVVTFTDGSSVNYALPTMAVAAGGVDDGNYEFTVTDGRVPASASMTMQWQYTDSDLARTCG